MDKKNNKKKTNKKKKKNAVKTNRKNDDKTQTNMGNALVARRSGDLRSSPAVSHEARTHPGQSCDD